MPIPKSDRVIYEQNPLAEVVCQLRFPGILRISRDEPVDFQEALRNSFPIYEKDVPQIPMPPMMGGAQAIPNIPIAEPTHKFLTREKDSFVSISSGFVAFTSNNYRDWQDFRSHVATAEDNVTRIYSPAYYDRVGLRYIDAIVRSRLGEPQMPWTELLQPHILGVLGDNQLASDVESQQAVCDLCLSEVPGGRIRLMHGLAKTPEGEQCYIIDADYYLENAGGINDVWTVLDKFHEQAGNLFRWAITDRLHSLLRPTG